MPEIINALHLNRRAARTVARAGFALAAALVFALAFAGRLTASGEGQDIQKFNQFVQTSNSPSIKLLREGRDLIDEEEWGKAAQKFGEFIKAYPKDKDADVAFYWLGYSLKKNGQPREAAKALDHLIKSYPQSGWVNEAKALLLEIAGESGDPDGVARKQLDTPNDQEEELKVVALQSLFEANPERAMSYVADILKPGSRASRALKEAAVSLLGSHGGKQAVPVLLEIARTQPDRELRKVAIHRLGEEGGEAVLDDLARLYDAERDAEIKAQILHAFSEMSGARATAKLLEVARNSSESADLRSSAIHWLGERKDPSVLDALLQIYRQDSDREVKARVLHAFSEMDDPRAAAALVAVARDPAGDPELRKSAIHWLGESKAEGVVDELMRIYESERDTEVKQKILHSFSEMKDARARQKLVEAARTGDNLELRSSAIHWLGESGDAQTLDMLIAMYDSERSAEIKNQLLHAFSESKHKAGLRKLIDVARRDPNIELRKAAIHWIGESDDPEAMKFLEELLKP